MIDTETLKVNRTTLQKIQIAAAARLDVMPGQLQVDSFCENLGEELGMRIKLHLASEKLSKKVEVRVAMPKTWWDHLKANHAWLQKLFGAPAMKNEYIYVDVGFDVCFPDYIMPKNMGDTFILSRVSAVDHKGENTAHLVEEQSYNNHALRYL